MEKTDFKERRAFPRFPVKIPGNFCEENSCESFQTQTQNISIEGLCLVVDKKLPTGNNLEASLEMIDNGEKIKRRGKVVWSSLAQSGKYLIGIRLEKPNLNPIYMVLRIIKAQRKY